MLLGGDSFGSVPFGASISEDDSVLSDYQQFEKTGARTLHFVRAFPYDPVTAAVRVFQWAQQGDDLKLTDGQYPQRIEEALHYTATVAQGEITARLGQVPNFGSIRVITKRDQGDTDEFERCYWDNRPLEVWRGFHGLPVEQWKRVLAAKSLGITIRLSDFTIEQRDPSLALQNPLQSAVYAGTGGLEGGDDLKDKRGGVGFGPCNNITPTVIDRTLEIVGWNKGRRSRAVRAFYDKGIPLTPLGDISTLGYATIEEWPTSAATVGFYVTDLANSLARPGGKLAGLPTLDVDGYVRDDGTFPDTTLSIVESMLRDFAGLVDLDLDLPSIARFALHNTIRAHYYQPAGNESTTWSVIAELLGELLGFPTYSTSGKFEIGQIRKEPPALTVRIDNPESLFLPFEMQRAATPVKSRTLLAARSYTVQDADALAGGVDAAHAAFVGEPFRPFTATASIPERKSAVEQTIETHLEDSPTGALQAEAARQIEILSEGRAPWTMRVKGYSDRLRLGRSVSVKLAAFRFGSGRSGILLAITEQSGDGSTRFVWWG